MARAIALAALAAAMLAATPAHAQTGSPPDIPELDGAAPPPLRVPKPTPTPKPRPAPKTAQAPAQASASALKAEQARLAAQAEAQKAEQARLAREAAELEAERTRLAAREAAIAAEEQRLAKLRTDQDTAYKAKLAELETREPAPPPLDTRRSRRMLISYEDAERACARAGMSEAFDRNFFSAEYDSAPRFNEARRELRGVMRLEDRRGFLLVNTICALDSNGDVIDFDLLR